MAPFQAMVRIRQEDAALLEVLPSAKHARTRAFCALAEIGLRVIPDRKWGGHLWRPTCADLGLTGSPERMPKGGKPLTMRIYLVDPLLSDIRLSAPLSPEDRLLALARLGLWQQRQWLHGLNPVAKGTKPSTPSQPDSTPSPAKPKAGANLDRDLMRAMFKK